MAFSKTPSNQVTQAELANNMISTHCILEWIDKITSSHRRHPNDVPIPVFTFRLTPITTIHNTINPTRLIFTLACLHDGSHLTGNSQNKKNLTDIFFVKYSSILFYWRSLAQIWANQCHINRNRGSTTWLVLPTWNQTYLDEKQNEQIHLGNKKVLDLQKDQ